MRNSHHPRLALGAVLLAGALAACARAPVETAARPAPQVKVRVESPSPDVVAAALPTASVGGVVPAGRAQPVGAPSDALPTLSATALAQPVPRTSNAGPGRISSFEATDQEISTVVRQLAVTLGLGYQVDPSVAGRVSARLENVTLEEALKTVIGQSGYQFQIQNGVIRVGPAQMETRMFTIEYVALSRFGTSSTVIQRRIGGQGAGTGSNGSTGTGGAGAAFGGSFGGGGGGGGDVIASTQISDLWSELQVSLDGIVFDDPTLFGLAGAGATAAGAAATAGGPASMAGAAGGGGARASGVYTRSGGGRMLTITPMSGIIMVTAPAEKLAEVDQFLRAFEGSVLRQVVIEAKIIEVNLNKSYQYGIDWNVIANDGRVSGALRSGQATEGRRGTLELTLGGGGAQLTAVLTALSSQGEVRVLSSPRVSALNNQRAVFDVTTDEVFFNVTRTPILGPNGGTIGFNTNLNTQQIAVGIVLDVLPQISADNTVVLSIRPVVTNVSRVESIQLEDGSTARAPVIDRRETDTMARIRAGETIVIGGLTQTRRERIRSGIPILRDIPFVGKLFTQYEDRERRGELVIFITPTITGGQAAPNRGP